MFWSFNFPFYRTREDKVCKIWSFITLALVRAQAGQDAERLELSNDPERNFAAVVVVLVGGRDQSNVALKYSSYRV